MPRRLQADDLIKSVGLVKEANQGSARVGGRGKKGRGLDLEKL